MAEADIPGVIEIDRNSFSLPWPERSFHYEVSQNELSIPLVAERPQGQIVGFIVVWVIIDEAHIGTVAVSVEARRLGIGELLVNEGLRRGKERGCLQAFLEVRRGNLAAIHLYQKIGFEVDGVRRRYYADNGEDALLMSLRSLDQIRGKDQVGK